MSGARDRVRKHRPLDLNKKQEDRASQTHAAGGCASGRPHDVVGIVFSILLGRWWIGLIGALVGLVFFSGFAKRQMVLMRFAFATFVIRGLFRLARTPGGRKLLLLLGRTAVRSRVEERSRRRAAAVTSGG